MPSGRKRQGKSPLPAAVGEESPCRQRPRALLSALRDFGKAFAGADARSLLSPPCSSVKGVAELRPFPRNGADRA